MKRTLSGHITTDEYGYSVVHYRVNGGVRVNHKSFATSIEAHNFLYQLPAPSAYDMIQFHMKKAERTVLSAIRTKNKEGFGFDSFMCGRTWYDAIDRLEAKGRIFFKKVRGVSGYRKHGYWVKG